MRAALVELSDSPATPEDFTNKLTRNVAEFREAADLNIHLDLMSAGQVSLSHPAQAQALKIVGEALTNIHRHAQAQQVWVKVQARQEQAQITIEDDGIGFDPGAISGREHLGLRLMRTRAERSGGSLIVESSPGAGTRVEVVFPLEAVR